MDSLMWIARDSTTGFERIITGCTLHVNQDTIMQYCRVTYRLSKPWSEGSFDPMDVFHRSYIPWSDWGAGLTHITTDHHLAAVTLGLMLVCIMFVFAYGRIR